MRNINGYYNSAWLVLTYRYYQITHNHKYTKYYTVGILGVSSTLRLSTCTFAPILYTYTSSRDLPLPRVNIMSPGAKNLLFEIYHYHSQIPLPSGNYLKSGISHWDPGKSKTLADAGELANR